MNHQNPKSSNIITNSLLESESEWVNHSSTISCDELKKTGRTESQLQLVILDNTEAIAVKIM